MAAIGAGRRVGRLRATGSPAGQSGCSLVAGTVHDNTQTSQSPATTLQALAGVFAQTIPVADETSAQVPLYAGAKRGPGTVRP